MAVPNDPRLSSDSKLGTGSTPSLSDSQQVGSNGLPQGISPVSPEQPRAASNPASHNPQAPPAPTPSSPPPVAASPPVPPPPPPPVTHAASRAVAQPVKPPPVAPKTRVESNPQSQPTAIPRTGSPQFKVSASAGEARRVKRRWWRRRLKSVPTTSGAHLAGKEEERRKMPSWLVSCIFHVLLLLILALVPIGDLRSLPLTLIFSDSGPEAYTELEMAGMDAMESAQIPEMANRSFEPTPLNEPLLQIQLPELLSSDTPAEISVQPEQLTSIKTIVPLPDIPTGISKGLTGRQGSMKAALLSKFGGTAKTEEAVELGLKWLAEQQKSTGAWSLVGPYSLGGSFENTTAATALALNAFLGAGYTHQEGKYKENVKLGLDYLLRRQDEDGFFAEGEPSRQQMYAQAIASIAVTEAYGMTGDSDLRIAAENAMAFAEWSQSKLRGWKYEPRHNADLSVTGWFVMALETGKMSGLGVDEEILQNVNEFLDSVSFDEDSRYAYEIFDKRPSLSMTAEGLLCRIYLGWSSTEPALLRAMQDDLLPNLPMLNDPEYSVYFWYYATQVLHHVGGPPWEEWNRAMRRVIPAMQVKDGDEKGSWDPSRDIWGTSGGRLYTTCLNIYCLEVYYRHLAIYDTK